MYRTLARVKHIVSVSERIRTYMPYVYVLCFRIASCSSMCHGYGTRNGVISRIHCTSLSSRALSEMNPKEERTYWSACDRNL